MVPTARENGCSVTVLKIAALLLPRRPHLHESASAARILMRCSAYSIVVRLTQLRLPVFRYTQTATMVGYATAVLDSSALKAAQASSHAVPPPATIRWQP